MCPVQSIFVQSIFATYKAYMLVRCCSFATMAAGCAEGGAGLQQARGVCLFPTDGRPCLHCRRSSRERATSVTSPDRSLSPVSDYRAARDRGGRPGRSMRRREQPRQVFMTRHGAIFAPAGNCTLAAAQQSILNPTEHSESLAVALTCLACDLQT